MKHPNNHKNHDNNKLDSDINNDSHKEAVNKDSILDLFIVYLKGIAMGMADIVPGVSGGTIALIAGVYHRFINALSSVDTSIWHLWREHGLLKGFVKVWQHLDATFVLCLMLGIATSFATLAGTVKSLLEKQPLQIWSLFFGLIIATIFILLTEIKKWHWQRVTLFVMGIVIGTLLSYASMINLNVSETSPSLIYLFFVGSISICAMILPGISGSFLLLLLGAYEPILTAVHNRDMATVAIVVAGMITGLLMFSKFLKWLLAHYYQATLALLTGFIAGSLLKIYPWKIEVADITYNVMPYHYPTGANWISSLALMVIGAVLVIGLSWIGKNKSALENKVK